MLRWIAVAVPLPTPLRAIVLDGGEGEDVSLLDTNDVNTFNNTAVVASVAVVGVGIMHNLI